MRRILRGKRVIRRSAICFLAIVPIGQSIGFYFENLERAILPYLLLTRDFFTIADMFHFVTRNFESIGVSVHKHF
jgi:hypothetical protein